MQSRKILATVYVKHVLIALVILIVVIFIVLQWLNVYTRHGKQVVVPDVKGMQIEQAAPFFFQQSLQYVVVDSMYVRNKPAGSILETVPPVGTNVKKSRTIYLTVNSVMAKMLTVPQVTDMSQRQAEAILRSLGFETIRIRVVPGAYRDLVVGLETTGGLALVAGNHIPVNTSLILLVSSGQASPLMPDDTTIVISEDLEVPVLI
ncbi:MAG: PASTA domain-containing protein [Dysgonamonadaceae bacterium]|jgi:beta-lactam-binding protein with PASTA domain|nr:PASTA domain-containing protein [Dysgonamonadaceae bacterium]